MDLAKPRHPARPRLSNLLLLAVAPLLAISTAISASAQPNPSAASGDRSAAALASGRALVQAGRFADAIPELENADQLAGGRSPEVAVALARAYAGAGAHAKAEDEARAALAMAPDRNVAREARVLVCQNRPEPAGGGESEGAQVLRKIGDGVSRPEIISRITPSYPAEMRKARVGGTVILDASIDEDGCVAAARVLRGAAPELDASALAAVMQWVFEPATAEGQPVKVAYTLTVNFAVETEAPPPAAAPAPGGFR
jgi:TonB family protein